MGNKGSDTTTTTTQANPAAMGAYYDVLSRAQRTASKPYEGFSGPFTAGPNAYQTGAAENIAGYANYAQPWITQAGGYATEGGANVTAEDIARHQDPYTQQVVDATQAQFAEDNARQQSQVVGNAAAQGALGGNRVGVAQALTADAQARSQAPVIAGLYSRGFEGARTAAEAEKARKGQTAGLFGNLGVAGQQAGIQGGQAQFGVGEGLRGIEQSDIDARMAEHFRAQGYDFQTAQWLASIAIGVGSQMGGTSETQGPEPNPWSQALGLGLSAMSFIKDSGRVRARGGEIGVLNTSGYVPLDIKLTPGKGLPEPPRASESSSPDYSKMGAGIAKGVGKVRGWLDGPMDLSPANPGPSVGVGGVNLGGNLGPLYAGGGSVGLSGMDPQGPQQRAWWQGFDDGGAVDELPVSVGLSGNVFEDRFSPVNDIRPNYRDRGVMDFRRGLIDLGYNSPSRTAPVTEDELPTELKEPPGFRPIPGVETAMESEKYPQLFARLDRDASPEALAYAPGPGRDMPVGVAAGPSATENVGLRGRPIRSAGVSRLLAVPGHAGTEGSTGLLGNPLGLSDEARQGLISMGLAMMANRRGGKGSLLAAVGEGGRQGATTYADALTRTAAAKRQSQLDAEKRATEVRKEAFEREKFERPYREPTAAERARASQERIPAGYRIGDDGNLTFIPGGPSDPDVLKRNKEAQTAQAEKALPAELAARVAMAGKFLDEYPLIREKIKAGTVTGTNAPSAWLNMGEAGEIMRKIKSGTDALLRNLTGAGMPDAEARKYVARYEPQFFPLPDKPETALSKLDQLQDELRRIEGDAYRGRGGLPKDKEDARKLVAEAMDAIAKGAPRDAVMLELKKKFGITFGKF